MNKEVDGIIKDKKIESLQSLRALAFLGIFFSHAEFGIKWPNIGVSTFFVLSGFLMYLKYDNNSFEKISVKDNLFFSWNKIKKIYPLHIITMIFAVVLDLLWIYKRGVRIKSLIGVVGKIFLNITLLQTWVPNRIVNVCLNGVAWYLSVTCFLYFIYPYICRFNQKIGDRKFILSSFIYIVIEVLLCVPFVATVGTENDTYIWFMYCFPLFRLADFLLGCCLGIIYRYYINKKKNILIGTIVEFAMITITVVIYRWLDKGTNNVFLLSLKNWSTVYTLLAVLWVWIFARCNGIISIVLKNPLLVSLGNISPYLFLIHYVVTRYTHRLIEYEIINEGSINHNLLVLIELAVSIFLSFIYRYIYVKICKNKKVR